MLAISQVLLLESSVQAYSLALRSGPSMVGPLIEREHGHTQYTAGLLDLCTRSQQWPTGAGVEHVMWAPPNAVHTKPPNSCCAELCPSGT